MGEIQIAVIGAGGWGKNLVRNFAGLKGARLSWCCDLNEATLGRIAAQHPETRVTTKLEEVLASDEVNGVAIATDAPTHFRIAKAALEAGKHVYVEKPLTMESADAAALVKLAAERDLKLMVGHLLLYHPAVDKLEMLVESGELGDIHYMYTQRLNLGVVRKDENAWWSLAPHDVSVILHLFRDDPETVSARGESYLRPGVQDVVFVNLHFPDGRMAQIHVSWLDPHKMRKMTIVGSKKMVVFDDMEASEKIKIYDKGAEVGGYASYNEAITLRQGDIFIPHLDMTEPLRRECAHFVECIETGRTPRTSGQEGLRVVRVLEAAHHSLAEGGRPMTLTEPRGAALRGKATS
ncbi:MAG: Gfo/Idh/MocA family oxidoreductase [Deltaproteobacteria bacterium]|nr:Gfo/Idh/MocA family oxidoreductase [Deltaproteobacteria bacterium]